MGVQLSRVRFKPALCVLLVTIAVASSSCGGTTSAVSPNHHTVVYSLTGRGVAGIGSTTYTLDKLYSKQVERPNQTLPWSVSESWVGSPKASFSIVAGLQQGDSITCTITFDGKLMVKKSASGPGAALDCERYSQ